VALRGGTCGYRFEKPAFHYPPSASIRTNFSKPIEGKDFQTEPLPTSSDDLIIHNPITL
jgi:hypothetical protein